MYKKFLNILACDKMGPVQKYCMKYKSKSQDNKQF